MSGDLITFGVGPLGSIPFLLTEGLALAGTPVTAKVGGAWVPLSKKERETIRKKAEAELARQEAMWAEDAKQRDDLRGVLLDAAHPERVVARENERLRLKRQIEEAEWQIQFDLEDEEDVEFLLLHS